jgi:hypothetical protein
MARVNWKRGEKTSQIHDLPRFLHLSVEICAACNPFAKPQKDEKPAPWAVFIAKIGRWEAWATSFD